MERNMKKIFRSVFALLLLAGACMWAGMRTTTVQAAPSGFTTENGKTYYYQNGQKVKGWLKLNGNLYYFSSKTGAQLKGWAKNSKGQYRYFTKSTGAMLRGWAKNSKGQYRYFTKGNGILLTGWAENAKGQRRYFSSKAGIMARGTLVNQKGQKRYFNYNNGIMITGWMLTGDYTWQYYDNTSGIMYTGLCKLPDSCYYYFDESTGYRFENGFKTINGKTYYFHSEGYAHTGWLEAGGRTYYFTEDGAMCHSQWYGDYYFQEDGNLARNMRTPDGSYVDENGKKCDGIALNLTDLKQTLTSMINGYSGTWSVYVKDLNTGGVVSINEGSMYPASVIKLFVMASTYDQINQGNLAKTSYVNGLLWDMITESDNEAYNELVRINGGGRFTTGAGVVNNYLYSQGLTGTECHSTLHPSSSSFTSDGGSNRASARDAGVLLEKIWRGQCVSLEYSREMLNLLFNQQRRWKIPAGIPSSVPVANKTGETSSYQHDVAIVDGPKTDYVVCIFSQTGEYNGVQGIKKLSSTIYHYLND